jgi:hypothetical protein
MAKYEGYISTENKQLSPIVFMQNAGDISNLTEGTSFRLGKAYLLEHKEVICTIWGFYNSDNSYDDLVGYNIILQLAGTELRQNTMTTPSER